MKAKKQSARAVKSRGNSKDFESALLRVGKKYPALAGQYAITKIEKAPSDGASTSLVESKRCVAWGKDPVTGQRICIRWE